MTLLGWRPQIGVASHLQKHFAKFCVMEYSLGQTSGAQNITPKFLAGSLMLCELNTYAALSESGELTDSVASSDFEVHGHKTRNLHSQVRELVSRLLETPQLAKLLQLERALGLRKPYV